MPFATCKLLLRDFTYQLGEYKLEPHSYLHYFYTNLAKMKPQRITRYYLKRKKSLGL